MTEDKMATSGVKASYIMEMVTVTSPSPSHSRSTESEYGR